jgi:hypothetical protein
MDPEALESINSALDEIAERLGDLAYECLRRASEASDPTQLLAEERRLRQAIRAVQRAGAVLRRSQSDDDEA